MNLWLGMNAIDMDVVFCLHWQDRVGGRHDRATTPRGLDYFGRDYWLDYSRFGIDKHQNQYQIIIFMSLNVTSIIIIKIILININ